MYLCPLTGLLRHFVPRNDKVLFIVIARNRKAMTRQPSQKNRAQKCAPTKSLIPGP